MNPEETDRRREQAFARFAAARAAVAAERARPARAGDLYALPPTARWPVEWVVIGPAIGEPGRLLAVPADDHPLAGSGDVAIPEQAPCGPLTVRCRFAVHLPAGDLAPAARSGLLGPEATAEVVRTCADLEAGRLVASDEQEEIESSPEYRHWIAEVIAPACAALGSAGETGVAAGGPGAPAREPEGAAREAVATDRETEGPAPEAIGAERGTVVELPVRRRLRGSDWHRALPLAASVLLAVSLALSGGVVVQSQRLERLEAEGTEAERRLGAEIAALEETRRRQAEAHRVEIDRLTRESRAARAEAERPRAPAPPPASALVNLPFAWLRPEGDPTRGEPQATEVAPTAGMVALILPIDDPGSFERFRLEIFREATAKRVWATDELVLTGLAETSLALPGALLPAGDYTLRLSGLSEGDPPAPLATYRLRVTGGEVER